MILIIGEVCLNFRNVTFVAFGITAEGETAAEIHFIGGGTPQSEIIKLSGGDADLLQSQIATIALPQPLAKTKLLIPQYSVNKAI